MSSFLCILKRNFRSTWSMPIWTVLSLVYPVTWLVLFGRLFGTIHVDAGGSDVDYFSFLAPGMVAATTVFGALFTGAGILLDLDSGVLRRIFATSAPRLSVISAYVIQSLSSVLMQSVVILAAAWWMGAHIDWSILAMVKVAGVVLLLGFTLSAMSHLLALACRRQDLFVSVVNFLSLPLLFVSSVLFPIAGAPRWLIALAALNPVHHGGELMKSATIDGYVPNNPIGSVAYLFFTGALFLGLATLIIRKEE